MNTTIPRLIDNLVATQHHSHVDHTASETGTRTIR
jgi:hypothetical protein